LIQGLAAMVIVELTISPGPEADNLVQTLQKLALKLTT
jgi:hypothetical protein